jgi:hypothetical protein
MIVYIRDNLVETLINSGMEAIEAEKYRKLEDTTHSLISTCFRNGVSYITVKSGEEIPRNCCDIILGEKL